MTNPTKQTAEPTPRTITMEADEYKARVDGDAAALRVIDELKRSLARRDALLQKAKTAITLAYGALLQASPCAAEECKQDQSDFLDAAEKAAREFMDYLERELKGQ